MNILQHDKQVAIIAALTEGVSNRAPERPTGVHRDTIMRLGVRIGEGYAELHDRMMVNLQVGRVELDEAWSYVGKKQRKVTQAESADKGDQYVFLQGDPVPRHRQARHGNDLHFHERSSPADHYRPGHQ